MTSGDLVLMYRPTNAERRQQQRHIVQWDVVDRDLAGARHRNRSPTTTTQRLWWLCQQMLGRKGCHLMSSLHSVGGTPTHHRKKAQQQALKAGHQPQRSPVGLRGLGYTPAQQAADKTQSLRRYPHANQFSSTPPFGITSAFSTSLTCEA